MLTDNVETPDDGKDDAPPIRAVPSPDLNDCPVVPLGFIGSKLVFAMPEGEIRFELASKIGQQLRTDIFACAKGQDFLTHWRGDDDKFLRDLCAIWFVRQCRQAGYWDDRRVMRSLGVWPGEDGGVVLHRGDEVWFCPPAGKVVVKPIAEAVRERRGPLYRLRASAPKPEKPATAADGAWARAQFDHWRFEPIGDEGLTGGDIVAGWTMAALLGAAAPFRGHVLAYGLAGSGKTTMIKYVQALQSALAGDVLDSFSEAGFRNDLAGMARPALLDEAEATPTPNGPSLIEKAIEVLRRMSTGDGSTRRQGDIGGGVTTQTAVGAAILGAITPPKLSSADASRFVEVRLLPLSTPAPHGSKGPPPAATDKVIEAAIAKARELAPQFLGRALRHAARYRADVAELKAAIMRAGETPRTADLISMLAAGRRLLMSDEALTPDAADAEVVFWRPLLEQRQANEVISNPGADALSFLLNSNSGQHSHDRHLTIYEVIEMVVWGEDSIGSVADATIGRMESLLTSHGLKVFKDDGGANWLIVANDHPGLERIYRATTWRDYRRTLTYLDQLGDDHKTRPTTNSLSFGPAGKKRGLCIPLAPWLGKASPSKRSTRSGGVPGSVPGQADVW